MHKYHFTTPALLGPSLVVLAGLAPEAADAPIAPGMARVWFLRATSSANGNVWAAAPMI